MKYLIPVAFALLLTGCGGSHATPAGKNPLLANGISKIQLYKWVHKANTKLNQKANGRSKVCISYEVRQAKAK